MLNEDLHADFYSMFIHSYDNLKKKEQKGKDKGKNSDSHDEAISSPIAFEISSNASKFAVFSAIRSLVLEYETKYNTLSKIECRTKSFEHQLRSKSEDEGNESKIIDVLSKSDCKIVVPHIVSAGIQTLFDIIYETKHQHPAICSKALSSLFDIFQGHDPESFKSEPDALFQSLYELLLDLATWTGTSPQKTAENIDERKNWSAISCSVLLALCVARGDTGKIIKAITSILMSNHTMLTQQIKLPEILIKLQKSVECAALGKPEKPTFFEHGIPQNSIIDEFPVKNISFEPNFSSSLASDGKFLYILLGKSLFKVGSGYNGTTKGLIYKMNKEFTKDKRGWIGFCRDKLYYKKMSKRSNDSFAVIDREALIFQSPLQISTKAFKKDSINYTLYSDGDSICTISAVKDDNFVIKEIISSNDFSFDLTLNLAKRSFRTYGYTPFEEEILNHPQLQKIQSSFNCFVPTLPDDSEINEIVAGKEFGLVRTSSHKVYYYGKGASLGLKSLIKSPSLKLSELTISKVSKIVQTSLGHDGLHTLLLSDDGSVFFAGAVRRGEDGEISKRRLLKPTKAKRISRLDNHFIVHVSCNNGTSAFVTKAGKLVMFGKDTSFCDSHGIVSQLHDQHIIKVALGKAHAVALNAKGQIFSFGLNNKGQCGRSFTSKDKTSNDEFFSAKQEKALQLNSILCDIDEHEIADEHCKICKVCFECTGYNLRCAAATKIAMKSRIPGSNCFCGHGNSGCVKCGACTTCISKQENDVNNDLVPGSPEKQKRAKKEVKINIDEMNFANESERVAPLPPAKVTIPSSSPIIQVSCGLHHTVLLTAAGEVFTFGSNQYGQLGTGDLQPVAAPVQVKISGLASQVAAGSNHTVVLSSKGLVFTFGNYQKGQLGRMPTDVGQQSQVSMQNSMTSINNDPFANLNDLCAAENPSSIMAQRQRFLWNCIPAPITSIGSNYRKKACWISASGDQTFLKIDESLVNASSLAKISVAANKNTIIFISNNEGVPGCITINKQDGKCRTHISNQYSFNLYSDGINDDANSEGFNISTSGTERMLKEPGDLNSSSSSLSSSITTLNNTIFTIDPLYDVLWCFDVINRKVLCFNILAGNTQGHATIFKSDVTLPNKNVNITRGHACLNILACLDTLAFAQNSLDTCFEVETKSKGVKSHLGESTKDCKESRKICRFEAFGGGWGYFGHSVEAVRFMCDTDILMEGIGMYGGRGEYTCKIKIFDLGFDGGGFEKDGTQIFDLDDVPFYCPARTIHNIMFQKPVNVVAGKWYLLWVKVSGPSSDCGSSGQNIVVGDDQVVFTFKSSKKSNNGTDINSGQVPTILYRVVARDRKIPDGISSNEKVCAISKSFINTISPESFENLVKLLSWSWNQFKVKTNEVVEQISSSDELLLNRFVYTCQVCLRLLKKYINEIYPSDSFKFNENEKSMASRSQQNEISKSSQLTAPNLSLISESSHQAFRKSNVEKIQLAESIGNVRALIIQILCDDLSIANGKKTSSLLYSILDECNNTFVSCFNAFYPTSYLKWDCLCDLLSQMDKGVLHSRLLSGVLAGLCDPTVNLKSTFSILSPYTEQKSITSPSDNSGFPILQSADNYHYPILVEQMMYRMQKERVNTLYSTWNFKEVLTRLLDIISRPVKLKIETIYSNAKIDQNMSEHLRKSSNYNLISNCCFLLSKILAEIVYQSCTADTDTTVISPYALQSTGIRFKKCDYSKTWNTGHFASDAICFTVDRPGIVLAGCCVYYGSGAYEYQMELLHDTLDSKSQLQHKWETVETSFGTFDQENVHRNMAQLKFERPLPLRENVCYALRFCSQGARTCSGDAGYQSVRGPCGTIFRFYPCDLSFNGTTPLRGQIPCLLYYSVPLSSQCNKLKNTKEIFARDIALEFASDIVHRSRELLILARNAYLYALSSSDKSSSNSSNATQAFDSEHNITPIEEHFDVSWINQPAANSSPTIKSGSLHSYHASLPPPSSSKDAANVNMTKDITKRIETFSRGIMETLKLDKKFDKSTMDCIEVDSAAEITANDFVEESSSTKKASQDLRGNSKKQPIPKSESDESFIEREKFYEIFSTKESSLFHTLLPLTVAHISRLICSDPKVSVEILNLVKSILPHVSSWNQICNKNQSSPTHQSEKSQTLQSSDLCTTSNFYAILESDHPYKGTSIYSYKVEFPSTVQWMSLEFDPQCGTAQPEDCLKILIPAVRENKNYDQTKMKIHKSHSTNDKDCRASNEQIMIKKFNTENGWSTNAIIVPGNEITLSLETASNYLADHKLNRYGFKCILIGYENIDSSRSFINSLINLESEFTYLGGMCSANLMRKDLIFSDEKSDDFWATENTLKKHSVLLSKGLSIQNETLTMNNILEYDIAIDSEQSHEKQFLKDFVFVNPDSAGGRLASWIQPESRLDPNRCELKLFQDPIQSGWPSKLVIETRDQYGEIVYVPNIKIQLKVALSSNIPNEKRYNKMCKDQSVFMPLGKVTYEPVIKEKEKICIKSITAMKNFMQYSFEELRMYTPVQSKTSDLMTAKDSGDQSYSLHWTPEASGNYIINIIIDGVQINENYNVTVINANIPPPIKEHALKKIQPQYKYRKYYGSSYTAGLRIRLHPTLQADQIGVIKVNDVISFIDELENGDGVWVKLSTDSIRKYCSSSWYPSEAYCLAYNKHFEKRLLFSLIESKNESSTHPTDDMNNVKFFDGSFTEQSTDVQNTGNFDDFKLLEDDDEKPPAFDETLESQVEKTNQSNITAAIAGVVEGGAHKLQAFQKWLKRDSIGDTTATIRKRIGSIPEVYNNNTLDLKNLNTDNVGADKLSNDINLTSPVQENSFIPASKINKVNENKTHSIKTTNPFQNIQNLGTNITNQEYEVVNTPKQALSPSIAETIRAIFAAFLWHEGLVHDAIACASFLKFHPSILKYNIYGMDQTIVEQSHEVLTKEEKIQQRHSVEITNTSNYLNARPSTLEALTKSGYCCVHYRKQRGKVREHSDFRSTDDITAACPPALKCLVFVWDELNKDFQAFVSKVLSNKDNKEAAPVIKTHANDLSDTDNAKSKPKSKKFIDDGNASSGAVGGTSESTVWCELCDVDIVPGSNHTPYQQNAFTQHLKSNHSGCGESAKGKGYNSNGVYCEGWAGQCGEEGVGATSWYLLCESCRDKYLVLNKKTLNVNDSQVTRMVIQDPKILPPVNPMTFTKKSKSNYNTSMEFFDTMKDNALFLLDLNSHNGGLMNKPTAGNLLPLRSKISARHSSATDYVVQPNTSNFFQRFSAAPDESPRKSSLPKQNSCPKYYSKKVPVSSDESLAQDLLWTPPESITCLEMLNNRNSGSDSYRVFSIDNFHEHPAIGLQQNQSQEAAAFNESKFHRSFSMIQGWGFYSNNAMNRDFSTNDCTAGGNQFHQNNDNVVVMRRKKTCLCESTNEASLLNFPSKNLKKLVPDHVLNPSFRSFSEVSSSHDIEKDMENALEMKQFAENAFFDLLNQHQNTEDTPKACSFLNRPTINFIFEKHDLEKLRYLLRKNLRKAICSVYGLQALNWLLRTVTQTVSVHDSLWWFISSLIQTRNENENALKLEDSDVSYEHPVVILNVDDRIQNLLSQNLHMLLQSIADITLSLPSGSALQRLAIQCFGIKFRPSDHQFLHNSHVFGNISKILSKSEEFNEENLLFSTALLESHEADLDGVNSKGPKDKMNVEVYNNVDITDVFELIISSRQAMVSALTDNSTETFWESDDEDRNKPKIIEISMIKPHYVCKSINIHIDNCRDLAHKVTNFTVFSGASLGELNHLETVETESNIGTWYSVLVRDETNTHFRVELRGVENNIRIRQLKILGYSSDVKANHDLNSFPKKNTNAHHIQQKYCELETLRVFRVLTNQVFGKLITSQERSSSNLPPSMVESHADSPGVDSLDLREHMVGILFSRSKLTHLQKQIIVHIVHSIQKEAQKSREEWELHVREGSMCNVIKSTMSNSEVQVPKSNDVYCFEMLSMVLALSGSSVGRSYLSHQIELIKDLFVLLHTGSERVQRQVTLLLRRILPEISPETLCSILEIPYHPHKDINHLLQNPKPHSQSSIGIIDILLAVIAKSLQIQVKFKNGSNPLNNKNLTVKLCDNIMPTAEASSSTQKAALVYQHQISNGTDVGSNISGSSRDCETFDKSATSFREDPRKRWFLCGTASTKLAGNIICLIKDMISGKLSEKWSNVTKTAVAECIVNLAHLEEANRQPETCLKTPTVWLALASLCVLNEDHVVKLSSGQWSKTGGDKRPLCSNHDDTFTNAVIECTECGTLCCDCDRFLHLNRKTWNHHRTVCKEEEESIKVELHESCGRIKLFWLLGLADSKTLKGIIEFRDGHSVIICDPQNAIGRCRFCGVYGNSGLLAVGNVCVEQQCQEYSSTSCSKILPCGHFCGGIINETSCLPCLHQKCQSLTNFDARKPKLTQDGDDMCMICFTEALSCAPSIQMLCGHVFHFHCSRLILQKRWNGAKISFAFSQCPICKSDIYHESLADLLKPINALKEDVKKKAVMRFKYEATNRDGIDENKDLSVYAMERYAYYVCCKCQKAYYGGEARCDVELGENFNPEELVCGGCSDIAKAQMCPKHGIDFLEYKCKFCCSIAVFFCFGTTHFCDTCHDDFQRLTNIPKIKLPKCPAGPKASQLMGDECPLHIVHPPTGEEFALGCGICRNFHTF